MGKAEKSPSSTRSECHGGGTGGSQRTQAGGYLGVSAAGELGFSARIGAAEVWQDPLLRAHLATSTWTQGPTLPWTTQAGVLLQLPRPLPASDRVHVTAHLPLGLSLPSQAGRDPSPACHVP